MPDLAEQARLRAHRGRPLGRARVLRVRRRGCQPGAPSAKTPRRPQSRASLPAPRPSPARRRHRARSARRRTPRAPRPATDDLSAPPAGIVRPPFDSPPAGDVRAFGVVGELGAHGQPLLQEHLLRLVDRHARDAARSRRPSRSRGGARSARRGTPSGRPTASVCSGAAAGRRRVRAAGSARAALTTGSLLGLELVEDLEHAPHRDVDRQTTIDRRARRRTR